MTRSFSLYLKIPNARSTRTLFGSIWWSSVPSSTIKRWFEYGIILSMMSMLISLTSFAMALLNFFKNNSLDVTVNLLRFFALSINCKISISPYRKKCTFKNAFLRKFLSDKIEKTKEIVHSLRSGNIDILQYWKFQHSFKLTVTSNELFSNKSSEDTANDVKLIYIDIIDIMIPYLNQFLIVEEKTANHQIEPSNIPVERAFGIFKFIEKLPVILQFGLISATSIAKFNHLQNLHEK